MSTTCSYQVPHPPCQVLLVIELLAKTDLREHLLSLRPQYAHHTILHTHMNILPPSLPLSPSLSSLPLPPSLSLSLSLSLSPPPPPPPPSLSLREGQVDQSIPHTLLSYCRQVAAGLFYLSKKGFIHRDIAARNILLSEDLETCKVDFRGARGKGGFRDTCALIDTHSNAGMASSKTTPPSHHRLQILACHEIWLTRPTTSPVEEKSQSNGQLQRYYTLHSVYMELTYLCPP